MEFTFGAVSPLPRYFFACLKRPDNFNFGVINSLKTVTYLSKLLFFVQIYALNLKLTERFKILWTPPSLRVIFYGAAISLKELLGIGLSQSFYSFRMAGSNKVSKR